MLSASVHIMISGFFSVILSCLVSSSLSSSLLSLSLLSLLSPSQSFSVFFLRMTWCVSLCVSRWYSFLHTSFPCRRTTRRYVRSISRIRQLLSVVPAEIRDSNIFSVLVNVTTRSRNRAGFFSRSARLPGKRFLPSIPYQEVFRRSLPSQSSEGGPCRISYKRNHWFFNTFSKKVWAIFYRGTRIHMSRHSDLTPPIFLNFLLAQVAAALPAHAASFFEELLGFELLLPLPLFFKKSIVHLSFFTILDSLNLL